MSLIAFVPPAAPPPQVTPLKTYPSRYYMVHSDLGESAVQEAMVRMTKVAEEYARRTQGFSGKICSRLPFYLFRNAEDYYAAGGMPGTAGVYTGDKLMAIAGSAAMPEAWQIVQHEGFHQFVHAVIGGDIPVWVNEGMAVYFQEGVFTGDGFLAGFIPQKRLERIRYRIKTGEFKTLEEMMLLRYGDWSEEMDQANYDQAWSMVHFLAHADNGRYQPRLESFLRDLSQKGLAWEHAWLHNFGAGTEDFQNAWRSYWENLPDYPTGQLYAEATVATLTSFLARTFTQKQTFKDIVAFFEAAEADKLKAHPDDPLPPLLVRVAVREAQQTGKWSLEAKARARPKLVCVLDDGTKLTGTFTVNGRRVGKVNVSVSKKRE